MTAPRRKSPIRKAVQLPILIERDETGYYVVECPLFSGCYTQGKTLDETMANLREAIELYFEGEDPEESGFTSDPTILVTLELEPAHA